MIGRQPLQPQTWIFCGVLAVIGGCGSGPSPLGGHDGGVETHSQPDTAVNDVPASDSAVASTSQSIGPAGGTVAGPGATQVTLPANATATAITVGITDLGAPAVTAPQMPSLPPRVQPAGDAFALTPHGATFGVPVTVRVAFDPTLAARAGARPLQLYTASPGGGWAVVPSAHVGAATVDADVTHFSFFIVGFETPEQTLPETPAKKLDMLFMVDNSLSMQPLQAKLTASFPTLIQTLKTLPGGLPDLHIGVVSSSMGAGRFDSVDIPSCPHGGDGGRLQWMPKGTCVSGGPTDHFIATGPAESIKNYPGTIEQAFTCIAALGDQGCGFEHQLESMAVALGARGQIPQENQGFLRADAALAMVMITNEDDCSGPANSDLYDPSSRYVADPFGPLSSYRCNEFGHLCGGARPPRSSTAGNVALTACVSAEDGVLNRVSEYATLFQGLKADPTQVFLTAIAAPPSPYAVTFGPASLPDEPGGLWPSVQHSCMAASGEYGDPAVRISQLTAAFGANGSFSNICDDFAPALTGIGAALTRSMGPRCLQADVVDKGAAPTLKTGCGVFESVPAAGGQRTETMLKACPAGPAPAQPCWSAKANAACTDAGAELTITRSDVAPVGAVLVVRCP
jgi:hypothetical protein